jgi:HEAT repeat protein
MTAMARQNLATFLMTLLALVAGACGGGPETRPEDPGTGPGAARGENGAGAGQPAAPANLLDDRERNQVLLDLDRLVDDWQVARTERRPMAYASIEDLVERKVDANLTWLVGLAGDPSNERGRLVVSRVLGFSEQPAARRALLGLLASDEPVLLENALMGLTLHPTPDLPTGLIAGHLSSYDYRVQRNAALALYRAMLAGATVDPEIRDATVTRLRVLLMDRDHPMLRGNVAAALGVLDTSESENDLLNLLGDEEPYPRLKAILALSRVGTRRALMPLVQMLRSDDRNTRAIAAKTLATICDREGLTLDRTVLGEDPAAWQDAIQARLREDG